MPQEQKQLISIGFEDAARWKRARGVLKHVGHKPARWRWLTAKPNLLYAFCSEGRVLHIGRSAQTLSRRFAHFSGEKAPSPDQEFQKKIGKLLDSGKDVSILVLASDAPLYWGPFHVDLAAGLEKSLLDHFKPAWSKRNSVLKE
jgi:hypothetical protein